MLYCEQEMSEHSAFYYYSENNQIPNHALPLVGSLVNPLKIFSSESFLTNYLKKLIEN